MTTFIPQIAAVISFTPADQTLKWCHVSFDASQITANSTDCLKDCTGLLQRKQKSSKLLVLCEEIYKG